MTIAARILAAEKSLAKRCAAPRTVEPGKYAGRPLDYCHEILDVRPWGKQVEILQGLCEPPYRVLGRSSHSVGKTFTLACAVCYWFDTFNPGCVITTAPTARDVRDVLWAEVRRLRQRAGLGGFSGDKSPELYDGPDHYAKGYTAAKGESFQGRHPERLLLVFDEAVGVDALYWETARTMFDGSTGKHGWLCMFNPTDTSSQAYIEEQKVDAKGDPAWKLVEVGSPQHPNIVAQLDGKPAPLPGAVTLGQFQEWLASWADPIESEDASEQDLEWPPKSGKWYRPGPLMDGRALGRWPSASVRGVWSERAWRLASAKRPWTPDQSILPQVGCDPARYGDDYTAMHTRWGGRSLRHERHNGWDTVRTLERLKDLAVWCADQVNTIRPRQAKPVAPEEIPIKIDADGFGASIFDNRGGFNIIPVPASGKPLKPYEFSNRRSELWFVTFRLARAGGLDLSGLPQEHQQRIRQQFFAPTWSPDGGGNHVVEDKAITKQRLGFSPDDADAVNLAYADAMRLPMAEVVEEDDVPRRNQRDEKPQPSRHNLFGRGR